MTNIFHKGRLNYDIIIIFYWLQVYYFVVDSPRNEGKDYFEINSETGEVFTKIVFDREKQGAYALEVEARDGAPSARPNNGEAPNSGIFYTILLNHSPHSHYSRSILSLTITFQSTFVSVGCQRVG